MVRFKCHLWLEQSPGLLLRVIGGAYPMTRRGVSGGCFVALVPSLEIWSCLDLLAGRRPNRGDFDDAAFGSVWMYGSPMCAFVSGCAHRVPYRDRCFHELYLLETT